MDEQTLAKIANDPAEFRRHVLFSTSKYGPKVLGDVMAKFQRRDFEALDVAVMALASGQRPPKWTRYWWERTKGGSKDSDLAVMVLWLILFSPRVVLVQIGAADQEQASEIAKIVKQILVLNPWMYGSKGHGWVEVQKNRIVNHRRGSEAVILSADAPSSHGARPDWLILNELSHVGDEEFAQTLLDNAAKVPNGLVSIATNAGHIGTWQHKLREIVRESGRWYFSALTEPAPWIDKEELEERRKQSPPNRFMRLWLGQWVAAEGDAIDAADIDMAIRADLAAMAKAESGWAYGCGVDLGIAKDHAAVVVVGKDAKGRYRLARVRTWKPTKAKRVSIEEVQAGIEEAHADFKFTKGYADPWQGELMIELLGKKRVPMDRFTLNAAGWDRIVRHALNVFSEGLIELFPHRRLENQLRAASVLEKTDGKLRLIWPKSDDGHGDIGMAFTLALLATGEARLPHVIGMPLSRPSSVSAETFTNDLLMSGFRRH